MTVVKSQVLKKERAAAAIPALKVRLDLNINIFGLTTVLIALTIFFSIISIFLKTEFAGHRYIVNLFDMDKEMNFPTYFEVLLLLFSSVLFFLAALVKKKITGSYFYNWVILSFIFLAMSADEFISLHEQTTQFFRGSKIGDYIHFGWLIPATIFLVVFIISYAKFFFSLSSRFKKLFFYSAAVFVWGAMGMELCSGIYQNHYGQHNTIYYLLTNFEETFEMLGLVLLIYSLLHYIREDAISIL